MIKKNLPQKSIKKYYRVDRRKIAFLRFIFEGYDGLAVLTTLDPRQGQVFLSIAPGCEKEVEIVLEDLKKDMLIQEATAPEFYPAETT